MSTQEERTSRNWAAVADAINKRRAELGMSIDDLIARSGVGRSTVRELLANNVKRQRRTDTLVKLAQALELPPGHLTTTAQGKAAAHSPSPFTLSEHHFTTLLRATTGTQAEIRQARAEIRQMHQELKTFIRTLNAKKRPPH